MKRSLAYLLAVLLLLCTACNGGEAANLNDEAFMPLPVETLSWESTLEDIQQKYPDGEFSTVGDENEPANYYMFYRVEQGDLGQALDVDVKGLSFMFRPILPYDGKENQAVLLQVSFTLDGGDYNSLAEQLDKNTAREQIKGWLPAQMLLIATGMRKKASVIWMHSVPRWLWRCLPNRLKLVILGKF